MKRMSQLTGTFSTTAPSPFLEAITADYQHGAAQVEAEVTEQATL